MLDLLLQALDFFRTFNLLLRKFFSIITAYHKTLNVYDTLFASLTVTFIGNFHNFYFLFRFSNFVVDSFIGNHFSQFFTEMSPGSFNDHFLTLCLIFIVQICHFISIAPAPINYRQSHVLGRFYFFYLFN